MLREFVLWLLYFLVTGIPSGLSFFYVVDRFLRVRPKWWARAAVYFTGTVTAGMIIYIADAVNILFFLPFFAAALWFCTEGARLARFSMILILYPPAMAFNAIVDNYFWRYTGDNIASYFLRTLFWVAFALAIRRFFPAREEESIPLLSPPLWLLLDILALTPAAAVLALIIFPSYTLSDDVINLFRELARYILPFVVFSSLGLIAAIPLFARHERLQRERALWDMKNIYFQNLEQEQTQVRRLRHDMANHLQALAGLLDTPDKARDYLASLTDAPGLTTSRRFCDNPIVNTVLASKTAAMDAKGITGDIAVVLPRELPLGDTDLCALFANAIDNAIEACEKLDDPDDRTIWVRARADKSLLMVQVTNRTCGLVSPTLETTKADKAHHGYGLSILREITSRAGGTCAIEPRPGVFEIILTVPMPPSTAV